MTITTTYTNDDIKAETSTNALRAWISKSCVNGLMMLIRTITTIITLTITTILTLTVVTITITQ